MSRSCRVFQLTNRAPCARLNTALCCFVPEYFTVFFPFVLSFYFNKMKIELGSKLCELFLSTFAEFSTGCMHPADPLFVNFGSLIAAMEMWSKIMIFSCDKWSSQGRKQHLFLNLFAGKKKCTIHVHVTFYSGSCSSSKVSLSARLASQAVSGGSPLPQADQRARQDHLSPRANAVRVRVRSQINQSDLLLIWKATSSDIAL